MSEWPSTCVWILDFPGLQCRVQWWEPKEVGRVARDSFPVPLRPVSRPAHRFSATFQMQKCFRLSVRSSIYLTSRSPTHSPFTRSFIYLEARSVCLSIPLKERKGRLYRFCINKKQHHNKNGNRCRNCHFYVSEYGTATELSATQLRAKKWSDSIQVLLMILCRMMIVS